MLPYFILVPGSFHAKPERGDVALDEDVSTCKVETGCHSFISLYDFGA
jgi:hypothetical protein